MPERVYRTMPCPRCRRDFMAEFSGEVFMTPACPACLVHDGKWEGTAGIDPRERIMEALDTLGFSVRRHGHRRLSELGDSKAVLEVRRFAEEICTVGRWGEVTPLYLYGPTGTGKSQIGASFARELLERGVRVSDIVFDRGRAMITQLQDRYGSGTVDEFSEHRRRAGIWIYDDAGTEKLTADALRVLEDILDRREGCPTLITSNFAREELAKRWAEQEGWLRLRSRLGPFLSVKVDGSDRRFHQETAE